MSEPNQKGETDYTLWFILIAAALAICGFFLFRQFMISRSTASTSSCINNLRQIDGAKDQWAIENEMTNGANPDTNAVFQYIKGGQMPLCPDGGVYSLNPVGTNPTCSIGGQRHSLP